MPCYSYSIPAASCKVGSKLREIEGSVCSKCYAHKGFYVMYPHIKTAQQLRELAMLNNPNWVPLMTELISLSETSGYFRWFDAGDIQSLENLEDIVQIAKNLPYIKFWLPTKEWGFVKQYRDKHGKFPPNLTIRLSAYMIDKFVSTETTEKLKCVSSAVVTDKDQANCRAFEKGGKCHDCRKCWDKNVENVSYLKH